MDKYICFIVAGAFAGLAGVLYVYYNGFSHPSYVGMERSGEVMLMVILGGAGTLFGPALGATALVLLRHYVSIYTEYWLLIVGLIFVFVMLFAPRGVGGYLEPFWKRRILPLWKR